MGTRRLAAWVLLLSGLLAQGREREPGLPSALIPDHARAQFAGASGLLSLGAGYGFLQGRIETGLLYGWVPEWLGGVSIHTLAQRTAFSPVLWKPDPALSLYPITIGYAAHFALGRNYDLLLEERFRGYYWPSALHFWIFAGAKARKEMPRRYVKGITALVEIGTLETYLRPYFRNESIGLGDILSLSLALQFHR
jgi:hypothetical protein